MFVLTQRIRDANHGGGFFGAIIYGPQRLGKSSYAIQTLKQIYGDWDVALDHTLFDLREVVERIEGVSGDRIPVICWDDAGVHANKMLYFANRGLTQYLQHLIDVVGINLGSLLITTPSPENLLKALRGYEFHRIKIYRRDGYGGRIAVGYQSSLFPSGMRLIRRKFRDEFKVKLPDDVWQKYLKKRQSYLKVAIENLRKFAFPRRKTRKRKTVKPPQNDI
jgi:hypothetical protein